MDSKLQEKLTELGRLLASTMMPPNIVNKIVDSVESMTEMQVDTLIEGLQNEEDGVMRFATSYADFTAYAQDKMERHSEQVTQEIKDQLQAEAREIEKEILDSIEDALQHVKEQS